jgi:hypothetical protein
VKKICGSILRVRRKGTKRKLKHVSDFALARFSFVRRFLQETKHCFQHAYSWATTMGNETKRTSAKHVHECAVSQLWFWLYRLVVIGTRKVWKNTKCHNWANEISGATARNQMKPKVMVYQSAAITSTCLYHPCINALLALCILTHLTGADDSQMGDHSANCQARRAACSS